jgi:hypothetical protein
MAKPFITMIVKGTSEVRAICYDFHIRKLKCEDKGFGVLSKI